MRRIGWSARGELLKEAAAVGNVQILKGVYAAATRDDIPSVIAAFDANIEWREAEGHPYQPDGKPWVGAETVRENLFANLESEWDGFAVSPQTFHDAGDTVVVECRYRGVHNVTGKSLDAQACHVWTLRNGKVTRFQQYVDTAQLFDVMGALSTSDRG
jgi:ketosteroid isomerase-like protein